MERTTMRRRYVIILCLSALASCRQILGIEDAVLLCPPELPACKLCYDTEDCGPSTECHAWSCKDNLCTPVNSPAGRNCSAGVCSDDFVSVCVECVDSSQCPLGQCKNHVCSRCDDGIQNGWETGIDCGGGGACKECLGTFCSTPDDCKSGNCVDGTCCVTPCDVICAYCGNPDGDCRPMPKYMDDNTPLCDGMNQCDGFGNCLLRPGEICLNPVDCVGARCVMNRCRKDAGEACSFPQECVEDLCVNGTCQK